MDFSAGPLLCLWLLAFSAAFVDAVGPSDTAVLRGGDATLTCSNPDYTSPSSGTASWDEGPTPFGTQQGGIYTGAAFAKYTNFGIVSNEFPQMDLTVSNAQVEDEGAYTCTLTVEQGSATLTVEIEGNEPTITLNSDPSVTPIRLTAGEQSILRCTASGFRPAVNLEWYKDGVQITAGVSEDPATANGDTFTTVGTFTFTPTKEDDGDRLECRTIGQVVATAKTGGLTLSVQFVPVVTVGYSGGQITCSSDANPLATTHQIIRNGTDVLKEFTNSPGSVEFTPNYCAVISCNASNTIGTGTDTFAQQICPELSTELPRTTEVPSKAMHPTLKSTAPPSPTSVGVIVGAVVAAFIGGVLVSGIIFYIMKRRHQVQHERDGLHKTIKHDGDHLNQDGPHKRTPKRERNQELPMTTPSPIAVYESIRDEGGEASRTSTAEVYSNVGPDLAFPRDLVVIEKELGRGAFGRVLLGTALGIEKTGKRTKVAVKTLKEGGGDHAKVELLEELELMKKVGCHPNVVKLLGHCKEKDPVYVIVEYLAKGDLKKLLMKYRDKDSGTGYSNLPGLSKSLSRTLVKFARDVANGMAFISSQKGALPMRWMALASLLDDVYTTESDVWSFGILLWEIVTLGARPYPMMKTKAMVSQLQQGYRMPKPKNCKKQLYDMMCSCWQESTKDRPTFQSLYQQLDDMLSEEKDYITIHKLDESIYEVTVIEDTNEKL